MQLATLIGKNLIAGRAMLVQNSPVLLTSIGVAGVLTTAVLAVRGTPKALRLIEEHDEEIKQADGYIAKKFEIVKATWTCYIPAVAVGTMTIGCIIASHQISSRRMAAIASLYSLTETAFKEYQEKVEETFGSNKERKVREAILDDKLKKNPVGLNEVIVASGDSLCFDPLSGRYFRIDVEQVKRRINELNRDLAVYLFISLNEVYREIGLSPIELGEKVGWHIDKGFIEPNFSARLIDGDKTCLVVNFDVEPQFTK